MKEERLQKIRALAEKRLRGLCVVLEDVHDPHNAAAIQRTCDALGVQDMHLVFVQEKPYNPRRVGKSSSSSANKWLSFKTWKSTQECLADLTREGYTNIATVLHGEQVSTDGYDFLQHERIALWVGNEHRGLSETALKGVDVRMKMPMHGMVESLNVSVAAALFLARMSDAWRGDERLLTESDAQALVLALSAR